MIEINLLPKELQKRKFSIRLDRTMVYIIAGCSFLIVLLAAYSYIYQAGQLAKKDREYQQLKAESDSLATEIAKIDEITTKKNQILARMSAIELLDRNREYWVTLMEDLAKRVPEYVWLTSLQQAPSIPQAAPPPPGQQAAAAPPPQVNKSSLEGYSFSLNALATFMIRLKKSDIFKDIEISSVKLQETDKAKAYAFKLTCNLVSDIIRSTDSETSQAVNSQSNQF